MRRAIALVAACLLPWLGAARAETAKIRVSHGYSSSYLVLMAMRDQKLIEKHAAAAGLGAVEAVWQTIDGGNQINDAMLAGAVDVAGIGVPGFLALWSKTRGIGKNETIGLTAISGGSMWLMTNQPRIKSLRDFGPADRIALPGIKTSFAAVALQMAAAKEFGIERYAELDPLTVGMPHPEAAAALMSGKTEITAHFASPPFNHAEAAHPGVHRVANTMDIFGPLTILMTMARKDFVATNPRLADAFVAATDEAVAFVERDKRAAAETYLRVTNAKTALAEVERILSDPETGYSATPRGTMEYARFMARAGTIKAAPGAWTDLFVPKIHGRPGS
jgi:NitT/TauT family transport system substrate-binding protein